VTGALPTVCILAGGLGTRLGGLARTRPKALVEVAGRPFVEHQLELLAANGAERVVLCVGHLAELIEDAVGDGQRFGLDVRYAVDGPAPIGTAAAIRQALPLLGAEFLVLYGDTYLRIDYRGVAAAFGAAGRLGLMTVLHNDGQLQPSNACFDGGLVTAYGKHPAPAGADWIDYGLGAFAAEAFAGDESDLARLQQALASRGELAGYAAGERFYEVGTPAAVAETDAFLRTLEAPWTPG
jgi:N-acetyl-alpha-D-muramate 1-phosphate uridylyltransferase